MTINIALVTNEALILGCDSVASRVGHYIDPAKVIPRDAQGNWIQDLDGNWNAKFKFEDLEQLVTNAWGGVQKMFALYGGPNSAVTSVAAVTAGLATLSDRTMSNLAGEFHRTSTQGFSTVEEVVENYLQFMMGHYDAYYSAGTTPDALKDDIEFLAGGYGQNDSLPSLYRINLKSRTKTLMYGPSTQGKSGLAWGGQAVSVQRLLLGYDRGLEFALVSEFDAMYQAMSERALEIVQDIVSALNAQMPEGINADLPAKPDLTGIFKKLTVNIDFQNMPLQDAIDFVAYLVNLESGKQKFVKGVPTVGGRTHIGLITRSDGFAIINPPSLTHRNTGFAHDI